MTTTAAWTTTGSCAFTAGQTAESLPIDYNNGTVTTAKLTATASSGTFDYFMSAHGGDSHTDKNGTMFTEQGELAYSTGTVGSYALSMAGQVVPVSQLNGSATLSFGKATNFSRVAQKFTYPTYSRINAIRVRRIAVAGTPVGNAVFAIQADSAGSPSGTDLATRSLSLASYNTLSTSADNFVNFAVTGLTPGNIYWIVLRVSSSNSDVNYYNISYDSAGVFGVLKQYDGAAWNTISGTLRFTIETGGYVDLGSSITLSPTAFSVSWWMKRSANNYENIFSNGVGNTLGQIEIDKTNNAIRFESATNGIDEITTMTTGITTSDGLWHHYCIVSDVADFKLYVDGVNSYSRGSPLTDIANQTYRYIGSIQNSPNGTYGLAFKGDIDEVRFYTAALSSGNVATLYAKGDYRTNLAYRYSFEEATGTKVFDNYIWESCLSGTALTFTTSGTDLRWRAIEKGGTTGALTNVSIVDYH